MDNVNEGRAGILNFPCGVERLPNGNTLVVDAGDEQQRGSQILEVDRLGRIVWQHQGDLRFPHSAVPLENGNLLVSDTTNNRILELSKDHQILFSSDEWDNGTGRMSDGSHLDYPNDAHPLEDGTILITDRNNNRFVIVTRQGEVLHQVSAGIHHPHNVDPLPNGDVIIADSDNNRAVEIDRNGEVVWSYGDGEGDEKLNWPRDADRLANGNTLICDSKNSRVLEVDPGKRLVWSFDLPYFANLYEADQLNNGNVLITDQQHQRVIEVDRYGNIVWEFRNYVYDRPINAKVENGSFKRRGPDGFPESWEPFLRTSEGGGQVVWGEDDRGSSIAGLRFDRSGGFGITQLVGVRPGTRYRLGATLRAEGIRDPAAAFIQCSFRDSYGGLFEDVFSAPKGQLLTGDTSWMNDSLEVVTPERATAMEVRLFITGPGTIWAKQILLAGG